MNDILFINHARQLRTDELVGDADRFLHGCEVGEITWKSQGVRNIVSTTVLTFFSPQQKRQFALQAGIIFLC